METNTPDTTLATVLDVSPAGLADLLDGVADAWPDDRGARRILHETVIRLRRLDRTRRALQARHRGHGHTALWTGRTVHSYRMGGHGHD